MKRSEECFQVQLVHWFRFQYPRYAELLTLGSFGENVGARRMKRLKQMGLSPGFPDLFLAVPRANSITLEIDGKIEVLYFERDLYTGLFLELKTKTGRVSKEQLEKHNLLRTQGYRVEVVRSLDAGMEVFNDYLKEG